MKKTLLTSLAIFLFVILGIVIYFRVTYEPPTNAELVQNKKSLHDLLLTPNHMCTFQVNDHNTGTLYAAESNFRVDFLDNGSGTHMISDLTNVFLWFEGKEIGVRVSWPIVLNNSELDAIASKILDLSIKVESQCSPWVVDSSKFELPDVDFKDFGKKIPGSINENEDSPEKRAQCNACGKLDRNAANKCRRDLSCF